MILVAEVRSKRAHRRQNSAVRSLSVDESQGSGRVEPRPRAFFEASGRALVWPVPCRSDDCRLGLLAEGRP